MDSSTSNFNTFMCPPTTAAYTKDYFAGLTFSQVTDISIPKIAPPGSALLKSFSNETPRTSKANLVSPVETIPHALDLHIINSQLQGEFMKGSRSVVMELAYEGQEYQVQYLFPKIQLMMAINNHHEAVTMASKLMSKLSVLAEEQPEVQDILVYLLKTKIFKPIAGFLIGTFPLWKLGCLLNEDWIMQDIFDARLEFIYMLQHTQLKASSSQAHSLYLPTHFLVHAEAFSNKNPPILSPIISQLQSRLSRSPVHSISMFLLNSNHYTTYFHRVGDTSLIFGDSMHGTPNMDVLQWFRKIFHGHSNSLPTTLSTGDIALQGENGLGIGSCAIAALNFAQICNDGSHPQWSSTKSSSFRISILLDFLQYHILASKTSGVVSNWVEPIYPGCSTLSKNEENNTVDYGFAFLYQDFNLFYPLGIHPIFKFSLSHLQPSNILPSLYDLKRVSLPFNKPSLRSKLASATMRTIIPEILQNMGRREQEMSQFCLDAFGTSEADEIDNIYDSSDLDDEEIWQPKRKTEQNTSIKQEEEEIDLQALETLNFLNNIQSNPIIKSEDEIIDLTTPRTPKSSSEMIAIDLTDLTTPSPKITSKKVIIDLQSPINCLDLDSLDDVKPVLSPLLQRKRSTSMILHEDTKRVKTDSSLSNHLTIPALNQVRVGQTFASWEEAKLSLYASELELGHVWVVGQSKQPVHGPKKKVTFRCNHYRKSQPVHSTSIDPSDHRTGKSIKTSCMAHININRLSSDIWHVTTVDLNHNHPQQLPTGGVPQKPATHEQKLAITKLATDPTQTFTRGQISTVISSTLHNTHTLEPRQISNIINQARKDSRDEVKELGGDIQAIISFVNTKKEEDSRWQFHIKLNSQSTVTGIFWQSPEQYLLGRRYGDLIINDNTYNRNGHGFPLNIGIVVDGHGLSRNVWYALQVVEDIEHHTWVLRSYLSSVDKHPEIFISDRDPALIATVRMELPLTEHIYCLHHLGGNIDKNLRRILGSLWPSFQTDFWATYRACSPDEFYKGWAKMGEKYGAAKTYLDEELFPCRAQWAWAWIGYRFTCGIRTNGRIEGENRVNKMIGGPKKTLWQLFNGLNMRTVEQATREMIRVRDSSRRQHPKEIESIFPAPLKLIRDYLGPFALHKCFSQMEESMYYRVEVLQRPEGVRTWHEYAIQIQGEPSFHWNSQDHQGMINSFTNDNAFISTKWLLELIINRGLQVEHLLKVVHRGTATEHIIALLPENAYVCDCCMGLNLGIPCRHYFAALGVVQHLLFDIKIIRRRWYQDHDLDTNQVAAVKPLEHNHGLSTLHTIHLPNVATISLSNPLHNILSDSIPTQLPTQTIPARTVLHEAQAAIKPLISGIQTQEQLDELLTSFDILRERQSLQEQAEVIHDPPAITQKGRPRTVRLTGALEGRARGGGAGTRRCTTCRQHGHTRTTCPFGSNIRPN